MDDDYPYKVWLLAISIPPLVFIITMFLEHSDFPDLSILVVLCIAIVVGAILAFPGLLLFVALYRFIRFKAINDIVKKVILALTGAGCAWTTFMVPWVSNVLRLDGDLWIPAAYAGSTIVAVFWVPSGRKSCEEQA